MTEKNSFKLKLKEVNIPEEVLIDDLNRVAGILKRNYISLSEYSENGKFHSDTIKRRFGSWSKALEKAELNGMLNQKHIGLTEDQLLENLLHVWEQLGRQPKYAEIKPPLSLYHAKPYERTFGSWNKALIRFVEWVNRGEDETSSKESGETLAPNETDVLIPFKHKTSRTISERLRFRILMRDGFTCRCGKSPLKERGIELEVDHKLAWTLGGETVEDNLETLCRECNNGKSNIEVSYSQSIMEN